MVNLAIRQHKHRVPAVQDYFVFVSVQRSVIKLYSETIALRDVRYHMSNDWSDYLRVSNRPINEHWKWYIQKWSPQNVAPVRQSGSYQAITSVFM